MMATWLHRRSTISSTCEVKKMVAPRAIMPCSIDFKVPAAMASTPSKGFVEEEDLRAVNYGGGHGQFFLHAVGIVGDELFWLIGELHKVEEFGGALGGGYAVESVHAAGEV